MKSDIITQVIFLGILNFLIAYFLGNKRQIGFWWSFILGFFLMPIISIFVVLSSKKNSENHYEPTKSNENWAWILIVLGSMSLAGQYISSQEKDSISYSGKNLAIGFILLGFYLYYLEKRKRGLKSNKN